VTLAEAGDTAPRPHLPHPVDVLNAVEDHLGDGWFAREKASGEDVEPAGSGSFAANPIPHRYEFVKL